MRGYGWSKEERGRAEVDRIRLASPALIRWRIYTGPIPGGESGKGFDAAHWGAWCIPLSLWNARERLSPIAYLRQVRDTYVFIRLEDNERKLEPDPELYHVLALPPEVVGARYGRLVPVATSDRSRFGAVPDGVHAARPGETRVSRMRRFLENGIEELSYPSPGDVWQGNLRQGAAGELAFYGATTKPIFFVGDSETRIGSSTITTDCAPKDLVMQGQRMNPIGDKVPSTVVTPQPTFIPLAGEFMALSAVIIALRRIFTHHASKVNRSERFLRHPAEKLDYDAVRKEIS